MAQRLRLLLAAALILLFVSLTTMGYTVLASGPNQDSYPPPVQMPTQSPPVDGSTPTATLSPYPVEVERDFWPVTPVPIGEQTAQNLTGEGNTNAEEASSRGLLYLWLGFLATFLIFVTSVIGATLLFTRRNES